LLPFDLASPDSPLFPYTTLFRSGLADAKDLKIDAAGVGDCLLVRRTGFGQPIPRDRSIRDVHVLAFDVHVLEEVLPHVAVVAVRSEEHTSELQSHLNLVCRLLLE